MSPLFTYKGKLLQQNGKLANNKNCCCNDCVCSACNIEAETIWYSNEVGILMSLNGDAYPVCNFTFDPPEIISGTINLINPNFCIVRVKFWRNIFSTCNDDQPPDVTEESVKINCTNGKIKVNNLGINQVNILNNGQNVLYNTIALDPNQGGVPNSNAGDIIEICAIGGNATFEVTTTLNWTTTRDHDLYGKIFCP